MASESQEVMENWPLELPGSGGLREPFLPLSLELWLAAQPCRYPLAEREKAPISVGLLGILVGLTLFFCSLLLRAPLGEVAVSVHSESVCRLVQYSLFWVGEKWKTTFGFSVTLVRGPQKAWSFPNLNHL